MILSTQYPYIFYIFYHFDSILFIQNNLRNLNGSGEQEENNSDVVPHIKSSSAIHTFLHYILIYPILYFQSAIINFGS